MEECAAGKSDEEQRWKGKSGKVFGPENKSVEV